MKFADTIHLLEVTRGSYAYLILDEEPMLIDTSYPGRSERILGAMAGLGLRPGDLAHILLTHHDVDHVGNAGALQQATGARVWASREDIPYIQGHRQREGLKRWAERLFRYQHPSSLMPYETGQRIGKIEILPTPGHTPGHVCMRYEDVLFAGDLVSTRWGKLSSWPTFITWDRASQRRSLAEIGRQEFAWILPAHGEPVRRGQLWEAFSSLS